MRNGKTFFGKNLTVVKWCIFCRFFRGFNVTFERQEVNRLFIGPLSIVYNGDRWGWKNESEESGTVVRQFQNNLVLELIVFFIMKVLAALCVGLTAVRYGANVAITSGMIYEFEKDSDEYLKMTMKEASWLRKKIHRFTKIYIALSIFMNCSNTVCFCNHNWLLHWWLHYRSLRQEADSVCV